MVTLARHLAALVFANGIVRKIFLSLALALVQAVDQEERAMTASWVIPARRGEGPIELINAHLESTTERNKSSQQMHSDQWDERMAELACQGPWS
jgi:hypothetical protein